MRKKVKKITKNKRKTLKRKRKALNFTPLEKKLSNIYYLISKIFRGHWQKALILFLIGIIGTVSFIYFSPKEARADPNPGWLVP